MKLETHTNTNTKYWKIEKLKNWKAEKLKNWKNWNEKLPNLRILTILIELHFRNKHKDTSPQSLQQNLYKIPLITAHYTRVPDTLGLSNLVDRAHQTQT